MEMTIVAFDPTSREDVSNHSLFNQVVKNGMTLYNSGYRLKPALVRGSQSMVLEAPSPGESHNVYRPVMRGKKAMLVALMLQDLEPWSVDAERIHETWHQTGEFTPDYWDTPDPMTLGT